jgi:hypothetical protein
MKVFVTAPVRPAPVKVYTMTGCPPCYALLIRLEREGAVFVKQYTKKQWLDTYPAVQYDTGAIDTGARAHARPGQRIEVIEWVGN